MSTTSGGFRSLSPTWKHAKRSDTLHTSTGARFFTRGAGSTGASSTSSSHLDMQSGGLSSGFYLVQITQNGWNSANFPDAGATRSGVGSVAVREECWSSASQRHAAICNRTRGGGRAAGWPPALATHLLMWHSPTESNELSLETSCRLVQICASDSRCESRRRCAHGALDQRLILRPGHLRGVRVAAKCGRTAALRAFGLQLLQADR